MHIQSLALSNFRCFSEGYFEFSPRINVICGRNARGKTSILEALYFLMTGQSFRPGTTSGLIRQESEAFLLGAIFSKHSVEQTLRIYWSETEKKIVYNSTACQSVGSLLGLIQGVVTSPDDVALVKGAPAMRRQFLDLQIAQTDPLYVHHLTRYNRALRQRNALLKMKQTAGIEGWEYEMANGASYLINQRFQKVKALGVQAQKHYLDLSGEQADLALSYKSAIIEDRNQKDIRNFFLHEYKQHRQREMQLGATLSGPHKDDLLILIGTKDARFYASEGQQRSCVAALRLAEWECLASLSEERPLLLIDDIGIGLDDYRQRQLFRLLETLGQVFITSTKELPIEAQQIIKL